MLWQTPLSLDMEARPASWYCSTTQRYRGRYRGLGEGGSLRLILAMYRGWSYEIDVAWGLIIAGQGDKKQNQCLSETRSHRAPLASLELAP